MQSTWKGINEILGDEKKGKNRKELTSLVLTSIAFYQMILKRLVAHSTNTLHQ